MIAAAEIFGFGLTVVPAALPWLATLAALRALWDRPLLWPVLVFVPVPTFLAGLFVIRLFVPKMKAGIHPLGFNRGFVAWYFNLLLARALDASGLAPIVYGSYLLKFLYWRISGAHIALRVNSSMRVSVGDFAMIHVGEGSTIADEAQLVGHSFVGSKLVVYPVEIGKNVFVGARSILGPKSVVGDGAWIGIGNVIYNKTIEAGAKVANFEHMPE